MLYWFLLYNNVNQPHAYIGPLPPEPPSHTPPPPFWVIIEHQTELPVLYSNFSPVFYFTHDSVYMLMLLSQFILTLKKSESVSHLVVSDSLQPHRLWPTKLLCPRNSPGKNTRVGNHSFFQGILTQGSNPGVLHCRQILYQLSHQGSP